MKYFLPCFACSSHVRISVRHPYALISGSRPLIQGPYVCLILLSTSSVTTYRGYKLFPSGLTSPGPASWCDSILWSFFAGISDEKTRHPRDKGGFWGSLALRRFSSSISAFAMICMAQDVLPPPSCPAMIVIPPGASPPYSLSSMLCIPVSSLGPLYTSSIGVSMIFVSGPFPSSGMGVQMSYCAAGACVCFCVVFPSNWSNNCFACASLSIFFLPSLSVF